jgi:hypothetical protein
MADVTPSSSGGRSIVTQRVPIEDLADLDAAPGRAALAFADERGPVVVPALVRLVDGRLQVGVDRGELPVSSVPERATLVVDDGQAWFELRAIVRRGTVEPIAGEGSDHLRWLAFSARSGIAWDYGRLREEKDEATPEEPAG